MSDQADAVPAPTHAKVVKDERGSVVWREIKGLTLVIAAVLGFHSFIAKPFYICLLYTSPSPRDS